MKYIFHNMYVSSYVEELIIIRANGITENNYADSILWS